MYSTNQMRWSIGGGGMTQGVKTLLIANGVVFLVQMVIGPQLVVILGLIPQFAWSKFFIWQFFTYMFLHGNFLHIFLNMYALWIFGLEIERMWGTREFYKYYFITGVGAGVIHTILTPMSTIPTIGASGAVMGILTAYAVMFPHRVITLLLFFILPIRMRARTLALVFAAMSLLGGITGSRDGIAHFAHLGGMLIGYIYMKKGLSFDWLINKYKQWKRESKINSDDKKREEREKMRRIVDIILDKANQVGMENLTKEEKSYLKKASKKLKKDE